MQHGIINSRDRSTIVMCLRHMAVQATILHMFERAEYLRALGDRLSTATYLKLVDMPHEVLGSYHDDEKPSHSRSGR